MVVLDLIVLVPLVLAVVSAVAGRRCPGCPRWLALGGAALQAAMIAVVAPSVVAGEVLTGLPAGAGQIVWSLRLDGLALPFVALTALIGLAAASASWGESRRPGGHFALLLLLQAALGAVFMADSLLLFYIAWESVLVPMFLLIGGWGSADARRASMKFLVYTFAGGAVLLAAILMALVRVGSTSIHTISEAGGVPGMPAWFFWVIAFGLLVKVPVVPLHTWLPDAHTEAPTAGSIILAGVLLKMGGYGLMRVAVPFAPQGFASAADVLAALGLVGIVWGAATALVQTDLKRLIAYSSVAHMGFATLAIAVATPASWAAAVVVMVSHGFVAGMLFLLVGVLYERVHTRELSAFGGLGSIMPRWGTAFVFAALASAGLPGLSGFPGEFMTFLEAFRSYGAWMLLAGGGVILAAAYNLRAVRSAVQGPPGEFTALRDLGTRETLTVAALAVAIVLIGLAPHLITGVVDAVLSGSSWLTSGGV
ncbi:MAG: NADH-quinone oxidoreductase subunit M [Coriobacteriia bacterium]|nr:NADH-quinone oxidoreductase subunit M [Coriobacteriia bacterium]